MQVGDIICTIEGDKAVNEIESMDSGFLRIAPDCPPAGTKAPVGTVLAYLVSQGEPAPFEVAPRPILTAPPDVAVSQNGELSALAPGVGTPMVTGSLADGRATGHGEPAISPRARRVAGELQVEWTALQGSGRSGRIVERDVRAAAARGQSSDEARVTPVARRLTRQTGVDLA